MRVVVCVCVSVGLLLLCARACVCVGSNSKWTPVVSHFFSEVTLFSAQGVTYNVEQQTWLISGRDILFEANPAHDFQITQRLSPAVPKTLLDMGCWHIGDVSTCGGQLYLPIERHGFNSGCIARMPLSTLQFSGEFGLTTQSHLPWVAVDCDAQLAYSSEFDNVNTVNVYRMQDLFPQSGGDNHTLVDPWKVVTLNRTVQHVQGGELWGHTLFLATNEEPNRPVYLFDVETGQLLDSFGTVEGGEGEGLAVVPPPNGGAWPQVIVGHTTHLMGIPVGAKYLLYQRAEDS